MKKVKIIDNSVTNKCYRCCGTGKELKKKCPTCQGSGKWIAGGYILIAETPAKQKIAFQVDTPGK